MKELSQYRNEIGKQLLKQLSYAESLFKLREDIIDEENLLNSISYEAYKNNYELVLNEIESSSITPNTSEGLIRIEQIFKQHNVPILDKENPLIPYPDPSPINHDTVTSNVVSLENDYNEYASKYVLSNGWKTETINFLNEKFGVIEDCKIEAFIDHLILNGITSKKKINEILNRKSLDELDELKDSLDIFKNRSLDEINKIISRIQTLTVQEEQNAKLEERLGLKEYALFQISELTQFCIPEKEKETFLKNKNKRKIFIDNFRTKLVKKCAGKDILVKEPKQPLKLSLINFIQLLKVHYPNSLETFRNNWVDQFKEEPY